MTEDPCEYDPKTQGLNRFATDCPARTIEDYFRSGMFLNLSRERKTHMITELSNARERAKRVFVEIERWNKAHPDEPRPISRSQTRFRWKSAPGTIELH